MYKSNLVPSAYVPLIKHCVCLNPEFVFVLWTDDDIDELIKTKFTAEHYKLYKNYTIGIEKSDAARYFILHHFGGIYMDMDVECRKPFITSNIHNYVAILDQEQHIQTNILYNLPFFATNAVMMSRSKHPFFLFCINNLHKYLNLDETYQKTGPGFLTQVYNEYTNDIGKFLNKAQDSIQLAEPSMFNPLITYHLRFLPFIKSCLYHPYGYVQQGCSQFSEKLKQHPGSTLVITNETILIHRFLHLGYDWNVHEIKSYTNILSEVVNLHKVHDIFIKIL